MSDEKISVAIVGGGETGTPLLRDFLAKNFIEVTGLADLDETAPGMRIAREHGIATSTDFLDLLRNNEDLDIVIDVTGTEEVRAHLRLYLEKTKNVHTVIMNEAIVRLLMSMSYGSLVTPKHGIQGY